VISILFLFNNVEWSNYLLFINALSHKSKTIYGESMILNDLPIFFILIVFKSFINRFDDELYE